MMRFRRLTTRRGWRRFVGIMGVAGLLAIGDESSDANAAAPTLDHFFPVAVQAGTTNAITAVGKFDPWPPKVWGDAPGIAFNPETNSGRFSVEVPVDAPVGPHLIRLFNDQGSSAPRFVIVTREPQTAESEPNDDYREPQVFEHLPAFVNGRLEKSGDVDSFAVELEAGHTLVVSVEAFTLGSPVDAVLRVVDSRGVQMAFNHDGSTLDPFLAWTAGSAGRYVVQVFGFSYPADSSVKFAGNSKCVYRLHLSRGPYLRHTVPLGVQKGAKTDLKVIGSNTRQQQALSFDGSRLLEDAAHTELRIPGFDNAILLAVGDGPERMEQEPNDVVPDSNRLGVPAAVTGWIEKPGDEDRFRFEAQKGQKFLLEVRSASLGFPVDPWLSVENLKGKELARNDDSDGGDPRLEWTAPEDGTFVATVGNVLHRGGSDYLYRLALRLARPAVKVTTSEGALAVAPGKTNELTVTAKRMYGFKAKLMVVAKDLPDGVTSEPADVPEKGGEVTLKFVASPEAKPFNGLIQVAARETDSGVEHPGQVDLTSSTLNNGVPGGFTRLVIESTDHIWLTVTPRSEPKGEKPK